MFAREYYNSKERGETDLEEGKNLAKEKGYMFSEYASDSMKKKSKCVFISHKKEDAKAAVAIGEYFTKVKAINIYLDQDDEAHWGQTPMWST